MTYSDIRAKARQLLSGKWAMAILVTFLAAILGGLLVGSSSFNLEVDEDILRQLPDGLVNIIETYLVIAASIGGTLGFVQFVLGGVVQLGYCKYLLNLHDGRNADIKDLFSEFKRFADGFVLYLLKAIYIFLWTLLFIIPGIVATLKYSMASFILLENPGMKPSDAITESKLLMDGHKGELFILELTFIGWQLLCSLTLGIGYFWLNPYMNVSRAVFYRNLVPQYIPAPVVEEAPAVEAEPVAETEA